MDPQLNFQKYQMWGLACCYLFNRGKDIHIKTKGVFCLHPFTLNPNIEHSKKYSAFSLYLIKNIKGMISYDTNVKDNLVVNTIHFKTLKNINIQLNRIQLLTLGKRFLTLSHTLLTKSPSIRIKI